MIHVIHQYQTADTSIYRYIDTYICSVLFCLNLLKNDKYMYVGCRCKPLVKLATVSREVWWNAITVSWILNELLYRKVKSKLVCWVPARADSELVRASRFWPIPVFDLTAFTNQREGCVNQDWGCVSFCRNGAFYVSRVGHAYQLPTTCDFTCAVIRGSSVVS
jgi:hypothetical protein